LARYREPVAVIGLGRFGTALALELARGGTEVLAVDRDAAVAQRLSGQLSQMVVADSTDADAMREIGVGDFTRVVVAIGAELEASILTTAVMVELGIEDLWVKALSRQHASIVERIGAHHVVLPEHDMGERIAHLVSGRMLDYIELAPDWVLARTRPSRELVGVALGHTGLRSKHGVTVVSVRPEGAASFVHAGLDTVLRYGDDIVIVGHPADVERFVDRG
jgi:trk system potassium uptake protein